MEPDFCERPGVAVVALNASYGSVSASPGMTGLGTERQPKAVRPLR